MLCVTSLITQLVGKKYYLQEYHKKYNVFPLFRKIDDKRIKNVTIVGYFDVPLEDIN